MNTNQTTENGQPDSLARACGSPPFFRASDVVRHTPTGEEWVLANDQDGEYVSPCGWPRCMAHAADCTLVEAATNEARLAKLTKWAGMEIDYRDGSDHRVSTAKHQLLPNIPVSHGPKREARRDVAL